MSEDKKETTPLTWIVTIVVGVVVFLVVKNALEDKPYLLFESNTDKREKIVTECKEEAYDRAKSLRESELAVLKAKENPTPEDLEGIRDLENRLNEGLVSRDDKQYFYDDCMDRYGY